MPDTGYRMASFSTAGAAKSDYEHCGQRQCFYTNGTWWMLAEDDSANDWWLWKWDGTTPGSAAGVGGWAKASNSAGGSVNLDITPNPFDFIWEGAQNRLHTLLINGSSSEYNIWTYSVANDNWTNDVVNKAPGVSLGSDGSLAGWALDSNRRLWLVYYEATTLLLKARSLDTTSGSLQTDAWSADVTLEGTGSNAANKSGLDVVAWSNQGANSVGVAYSYSTSSSVGPWKFQYRPDSAAVGDAWTVETIHNDSDVDSHITVIAGAVGGSGDTLFVLAKNSSSEGVFYKRPPGGPWDAQIIVYTSGDSMTRPKLCLDSTNNTLYAFAHPGGGGVASIARVVYKTSPTGTISFSAATTVLEKGSGTNGDFNTCGLPVHNVTGTQDLLVMSGGPVYGADQVTTWWNIIAIAAAAATNTASRRRRR